MTTASFLEALSTRRHPVLGWITAFGLAVAGLVSGGSESVAQEAAKGPPPKPLETFQRVQTLIGEGKYDLAAYFLQLFVDSNPTDQDLLAIENRYGTTVFRQLRTIPRWSDDEKLDKQTRANVEAIVKRTTEATEKLLRNPARVTKFIRNLGASYEERLYAEVELRRTGDYAIPFMVDALRTSSDPALSAAIIGAIPKLEGPSTGGWIAALDGLSPDLQYGVVSAIASRPDVLRLLSAAQTDFVPYLWRFAGREDTPATLQKFAKATLERLVRGANKKQPATELVAAARPFADRKGQYLSVTTNPDGTPATVSVWTWNAADQKLVKQEGVPVGQADEYYGLRYARWALEIQPDYAPAQVLVLALATDRAMERGKFGNLAKTDPSVYRMLADAPTTVLTDLLDRSLFEKRTGLVLALTQVLGDRGEKRPANPATAGKPSLFERALDYPDPRVQLAAASALLRSTVDPKLRGRVLEVLKRAASADPGVPSAAKGQALLADPNRKRADDTAVMLRQLGYDVERYSSGRELLRRVARASDFDLILIDHHIPNPELLDVVSHLRADVKAAKRPILVVASTNEPIRPSLDQLLLRFALLIAATDVDAVAMPEPFVPSPRLPQDQWESERIAVRQRRDNVFRTLAQARTAQLQRVLNTSGIELTNDQKFQIGLRVAQVTFAALAAEFPLTPESSPETYKTVASLADQIKLQPDVPAYAKRVGLDHLMKMLERFEVDVSKVKSATERYEALRTKVNPEALGLAVRTTRDPVIEARVSRLVGSYPAVRVIPEPYSLAWFETDVNNAFADPADRPRDPAEKRAAAKLAVGWLAKMATGEVTGFDPKLATPELIAALRMDDFADLAIDGVAKLPSAEAQQALVSLALTNGRPLPLRLKAVDAAIRNVQANGKLTPDSLVGQLNTQAASEPDADLRGKFLLLKGLLSPNSKTYLNDLRSYSPPLIPPPAPKGPAPVPKNSTPPPPEEKK